jgi:hypothetical protein
MPRSRIRRSIHSLAHTPSWRSACLLKHRDKFHLSCLHKKVKTFGSRWDSVITSSSREKALICFHGIYCMLQMFPCRLISKFYFKAVSVARLFLAKPHFISHFQHYVLVLSLCQTNSGGCINWLLCRALPNRRAECSPWWLPCLTEVCGNRLFNVFPVIKRANLHFCH